MDSHCETKRLHMKQMEWIHLSLWNNLQQVITLQKLHRVWWYVRAESDDWTLTIPDKLLGAHVFLISKDYTGSSGRDEWIGNRGILQAVTVRKRMDHFVLICNCWSLTGGLIHVPSQYLQLKSHTKRIVDYIQMLHILEKWDKMVENSSSMWIYCIYPGILNIPS